MLQQSPVAGQLIRDETKEMSAATGAAAKQMRQ